MVFVPKTPKKVQYLLDFSYPQIAQFCPRKPFVGGRIGYDKQLLFLLLREKKISLPGGLIAMSPVLDGTYAYRSFITNEHADFMLSSQKLHFFRDSTNGKIY